MVQAGGRDAKDSMPPPPVGTGLTASRGGVPQPGRGRRVSLRPGHSPLDWERLRTSGKDMRGLAGMDSGPGLLRVSRADLATHNRPDDAWTALGGKVYNITAYLSYHPGGEGELLRCAGRDGTKLFLGIHGWVNYERLLDHCLIGVLSP